MSNERLTYPPRPQDLHYKNFWKFLSTIFQTYWNLEAEPTKSTKISKNKKFQKYVLSIIRNINFNVKVKVSSMSVGRCHSGSDYLNYAGLVTRTFLMLQPAQHTTPHTTVYTAHQQFWPNRCAIVSIKCGVWQPTTTFLTALAEQKYGKFI